MDRGFQNADVAAGDFKLDVHAALFFVQVQEMAGLFDHWLGRIDPGTGPSGNQPKLSEISKLHHGVVANDFVSVAADPENRRFWFRIQKRTQIPVFWTHRI